MLRFLAIYLTALAAACVFDIQLLLAQPKGVDQAALQLPATQSVSEPPNIAQSEAVGAPMASLPAQRGVAPQAPRVGPPFQLSPVEQQFVDQILQMWENESAKIKTFDCRFERWEYDPVFGPGNNIPAIKSIGQLTYAKPDKGSFKINEIRRWTQPDKSKPGDHVLQEHEVGEHWVCDGKAIFEYKHEKKHLVVQPLPPVMRGTAIVDGPLPFLFGAEAAKLKQRYWIRSKQGNAATIWLEAYPRSQADAANYHHVEVMLQRKTMMPTAIQMHMPNGHSRAVYMFQNPTVNGRMNQLFGAIFSAPRTPLGWKRVVQEIPASGPQAATPSDTAHR